jgi:hypothetical protein
MSPAAQLTSEQPKENYEHENTINKSAMEVQQQVKDGEVFLDPANTSSVLNIVLSTMNS